MKKSHPDLIMNIDETGFDYKKNIEKIKVVSTQKCPWVYQSMRGESYITFVPIIGIIGWLLPILVVLKTLSVISDLAIYYSFPISN